MVPLALSGLVRHVPGIPKIHWPTLRWAVSNFVGDIVAYQVGPNSRVVYDAVHACVDEALRRLAAQGTRRAADRGRAQPGQRHRGRSFLRPAQGSATGATPLERGETFTSFYTLGSPIALWMERFGDFSRPVQIPGKTSDGPGDRRGRRMDQLLRRRRRAGLPAQGPVRATTTRRSTRTGRSRSAPC